MSNGIERWDRAAALLRATESDGEQTTIARVWVDDSGVVQIDNEQFADLWRKKGIVGRADHGRLYPKDGQAFVDELPYMYKGSHLRAQPIPLLELLAMEMVSK